ncbi:bolA-like protein 2 [Mercenaria mercenaria]|uniref:bolA-like protein 2 n=1 Tax=Mercenaria mercenaria TaxID=6596 RepID=UPI001E1DFA9C|nr:bolA-like protein 2 [Mercenaria mercenaria]
MPITVDYLKEKLKNDIGATHLDIEDTSDGCGAKFQAVIVSPQFEGKPLLQRHRLVNAALEAEMKEIHAFQMKTLTPEQWEKQKS